MNAQRYDAIVVGARCAGASSAMLMARRGMKVLLVERGEPGTDTVSSHNLTRGAVTQLVRWGLADRLIARGTPSIHRTTFHFGPMVMPIDVKPVMGAPGLFGTRRPVLDTTLAEAAVEAGADLRCHTTFRDVIRDDEGKVAGAILADDTGREMRVEAPLVVGADGIRSMVARRVGAATRREATHALGHIYSYFENVALDDNHCFFAPGIMVGSTPTNDGAAVVIATTHPDRLRAMRDARDDAEVLRALAHKADAGFGAVLDGARRTEAVRVFAGTKGFVRDCAGSGWALVGDAGYFRDPVTAHGITDAFRDAELLANAAAVSGPAALARYQEQRDHVTRPIWEITERLAAFDMPLPQIAAAFHDLSKAMRAEQEWMAEQFAPLARAA